MDRETGGDRPWETQAHESRSQAHETPLHEELGFASAEHLERARALQSALLKETDLAQADKLRADLKMLLDDTNGEPKTGRGSEPLSSYPVREVRPRRQVSRVDSDEERDIAQAEHKIGLRNAARRIMITTIDELQAAGDSNKLRAHLDELEQGFSAARKKIMRTQRAEIESAPDPLQARAEAIKTIYADTIARINKGLQGDRVEAFVKDQRAQAERSQQPATPSEAAETQGASVSQDQQKAA